ncbi:MAG: SURF1 family protein [Actinomycetia bacterium]|nr:SURF1 family protein [Actinomycetes bacterium]
MYSFLVRPKWIAFHLLCVALIVVMINLAFWQLRRLDERQALNDRVAAQSTADVVPLADISLADPGAVEYRQVEVTGTYLDIQFEVVNLSQAGTTGSDPVNVLRLADDSLILVNRGFLPFDADLVAPPSGEVTVTGRLRPSKSGGTDQRDDDDTPQVTEIRRIDVAAIANQLMLPVAPMYIELLESTPSDSSQLLPVPLPEAGNGPHLSYTIQWFIFSVCVAVGWVFAVRKSARKVERTHTVS